MNGHKLNSITLSLTKYIREYYEGERHSALGLLVLAILVIVAAYFINDNIRDYMAQAFAIGLLALSLIQIFRSLVICLWSIFKENQLNSGLDEPELIVAEYQRMKKEVLFYPKIRRVQEVFFVLSLIGIFIALARVLNPTILSPAIGGIAMAILFQVSVWIANDLFAERRAQEYERRLRIVIENNENAED